jgi:hypothetical protein
MKEQKIQLLIALVGFAIGAFMLHYKIHPPQGHLTNFWASFFSGIDLVVVTALFLRKSTAVWGLLLNSFLAFIGIIMMTDLSIVSVHSGWITGAFFQAPFKWLLQTMIPDIAILVSDFMVGLVLYKITITMK